jgi:dienelactone hydrolase
MNNGKLEYAIGHRLCRGYLSGPDHDMPVAAVVVFPDAAGVSDYAQAVADRLAALGYRALVADPYGDGRTTTDPREAMALATALREDRLEWRRRMRAAYDVLAARPDVDGRRITAIGYCMGGTACLDLARGGASLAAIGTFHAVLNLALPGDSPITAPVLVQTGADDALVPLAALGSFADELRAGGSDWQIVMYGGTVHGFTNPRADNYAVPERVRHNPVVDRRSWAALTAFLAEVLA